MSASSLDDILPLLREPARQPGLSQAAEKAVRLLSAVQNVRSEQIGYTRLAIDACELLYVVAGDLRERGQRNIDNELKRCLDELTGVLEKILELAEANAARGVFSAFWNSDANKLGTFREQLEQCLRVFGIRSFADLQYKAKERAQTKNVNTTTVNNSRSFLDLNISHTNQGDHDMDQEHTYRREIFGGARDYTTHGAPNSGLAGSKAFS